MVPVLEAHRDAQMLTHPLVLAEVAHACLRGRTTRPDAVRDVEDASEMVALTRDDAMAAAGAYVRLRAAGRAKLSLADCLIHASAQRVGATLVTKDSDLRKEPGVLVVASVTS